MELDEQPPTDKGVDKQMKTIARAILWIIDHEMELWLVAFPFLLVSVLFALKDALEMAMW